MEAFDIEKCILSQIKSMREDNKLITENTMFEELEFDDIDFIELTVELEEAFDIFLDEKVIEEKKNAKNVSFYVYEEIKKKNSDMFFNFSA
jgi:acyl carrier protein